MKKTGRWTVAAAVAVACLPAAVAVTATAGPAQAGLARARAGQTWHDWQTWQAGRAGGRGAPGLVPPADVGGSLMASHGVVVRYASRSMPRLPRIRASAFVIADAGTGQVLAAKDAHGLFPPASTLKVLTAITLIPQLNPSLMIRTSHQAATTQPNIVGLIAGRWYRVSDLMRALLMISANDAAVALAQGTGSLEHGIALMMAEAKHLQAYDVVAKNPNGLPATGQVVSAYDLALIARQALAMPAFMGYDSTLFARFPLTHRKRIALVNQNYLLTHFRGGIGGKIGWTEKAEATYVGLARRHGVTLIVTILHCTPLQEIAAAEKLLNWGFAADGTISAVGTLVSPLPVQAPRTAKPSAGSAARSRPVRPPVADPVAAAHQRDVEYAAGGSAVVAVAACALTVLGLRRRARRSRSA